jgi:hypothetical protein
MLLPPLDSIICMTHVNYKDYKLSPNFDFKKNTNIYNLQSISLEPP